MAGNRNEEMVYCSFCGKNQEEVKKIIAGNGVFICNECVALSQEIIREEWQKKFWLTWLKLRSQKNF